MFLEILLEVGVEEERSSREVEQGSEESRDAERAEHEGREDDGPGPPEQLCS
tara:strand:- start:254 stop:409 length:156 start_codon:yes stop_codon:yes gene_type:complete